MEKYLLHKKVLEYDAGGVANLIELKVDLNELDSHGQSPLHWAVFGGYYEIAEMLLKAGADPNSISRDGVTPKWRAEDFGLDKIVVLLAAYGGRVDTNDSLDRKSFTAFNGLLGIPLPKEEKLPMIQSVQKIRAIITGATGMVGEGVLHECLLHDAVETVLVIGRKPCGVTHPKLKEILHADFFNLSSIENALTGYNACFFCLGVSSVGLKEDAYYKLTYTLTMHVAETLARLSPEMVFCYISGAGTDSTEKGRSMWARVKGKTENDLIKLPFKQVYNFRPGVLKPTQGLRYTHKYYKYLGWLYPFLRAFFPATASTLRELGLAIINAASIGYNKHVVEVRDIVILAKG